jgi:hypothetical protein
MEIPLAVLEFEVSRLSKLQQTDSVSVDWMETLRAGARRRTGVCFLHSFIVEIRPLDVFLSSSVH